MPDLGGAETSSPLRRRSTWLLIALSTILLYWIWTQIPSIGDEDSFGNSLSIVLLINVNIVLVMVLGFVVLRNLVKLLLDRRKGILGARLRSRLVVAFVGLSLVPTVLLFLVAKGLVERALEKLFSPQVQAIVDGSLEVARSHYALEEGQLLAQAEGVAKLLRSVGISPGLDSSVVADDKLLQSVLDTKRQEYGLTELALLSKSGELIWRSIDPAYQQPLPTPHQGSLARALDGKPIAVAEQAATGEYLRSYVSFIPTLPGGIEVDEQLRVPLVILATTAIPTDLVEGLEKVIGAYDDYKEVGTHRQPLTSGYLLSLVIITLMIIFVAIWVGFYLARSLTEPVQQLASGTVEVAHGNLDIELPVVADDELGVLVQSFNKMTRDLKGTTGELVARRRYMETVLESLNVGVISVDSDFQVTTLNVAAAEILGMPHQRQGMGIDSLPKPFADRLCKLLGGLAESDEKVLSINTSFEAKGETKQLVVTMNKLVGEAGQFLGIVILIDDLTALVSAQRVAAWREVARRIAHEIKNPLTPIQLSAQRIQRRWAAPLPNLPAEEQKVISEGTEIILKQVETLRNLIDEFSRFARMPQVQLSPTDLNRIIEDTLKLYRDSLNETELSAEIDPNLPKIDLDAAQIARVLVNLLDNAIASIEVRQQRESIEPRIQVRSRVDSEVGVVALEVEDNGIGIPEHDKARLFEPYFSRRQGGTGLGLAIVNTIVADHNGFIRVRDNAGGGAIFIVELPVSHRVVSHAR